jgi:hypothetical protein
MEYLTAAHILSAYIFVCSAISSDIIVAAVFKNAEILFRFPLQQALGWNPY